MEAEAQSFLSALQDIGHGTGEQWYNEVKNEFANLIENIARIGART